MGHEVSILTLSRGARGGLEDTRASEAQQAAEVIGATLYHEDLKDTSIAEGDPTISVMSRVVAEVRPTVIYTHSLHDIHQDEPEHPPGRAGRRARGGPGVLLPVAVGHGGFPAHPVRAHRRPAGRQAAGHRRVRVPGGDPGLPGARPYFGHRAVLVPVLRAYAEPFEVVRESAIAGRYELRPAPGVVRGENGCRARRRSTRRLSRNHSTQGPGRYRMQPDEAAWPPVTVLVTGAGGPAAVSVIKSLRTDPSVRLVAANGCLGGRAVPAAAGCPDADPGGPGPGFRLGGAGPVRGPRRGRAHSHRGRGDAPAGQRAG